MEKEEKVKEGKSHVVLITVLVVALLIVFFFLGYAVGGVKTSENSMDIAVENQKTDETKEEVKEVEKTLTEGEVSSQLEILGLFTNQFADKYPLETKAFSNEDVLQYVTIRVRNGESFSATLVSDYIEKLFGKDYSYHHEDVNCGAGDGIIYKYDASTQTYTFTGSHGHGGPGASRSKIYFVSAIEKGDTLTINTKILYGGWCGDTCGPIMNFYAKYPFDTSIYDVPDSDLEKDNYDVVYEQKKDLLPITSFIYKKQSDGNFGLVEVKIQ